MTIVCAFMGSGKTASGLVDLDYGVVRNGIFKTTFTEEQKTGKRLYESIYLKFIDVIAEAGYEYCCVNEPHILYDCSKYDVVFVTPSFGVDEWKRRILGRGDDPNADWFKYIVENYDKCVSDWDRLAKNHGYQLVKMNADQYLTDVLGVS